jgi:hypothetical protein
VTSALVVTGVPAPSDASDAPARQTGKIVSENPDDNTPDILTDADPATSTPNTNTVYSIARVGDQIVVGGKFTQVTDHSTSGPHAGQTLNRQNVFSFDASTGEVSDFDPSPNGVVQAVHPGRDGKSVYLGGAFDRVRPSTGANRVDADNLAKFTVSSGKLNPSFKSPGFDGVVFDIENVGSRLWVAGHFGKVGTANRRGIVALSATSGQRSSYFNMTLSGTHNPKFSQPFVKRLAVNPAQTAVVAIGSFTSVNGEKRYQVAKFGLGRNRATLSPWTTPQFRQSCNQKFETTMTDVQYAPNGNYFVVSSTGGYGGFDRTTSGISGCDLVARFAAGSTARGTRPTWLDYTGGDTTWTIEVTDSVIYTGGHMRWQNNPDRGDNAGPGAVERTGIAALDPANGLPYSWNPTRSRGVGVQDMLATDDGLYVGSDTERIGNGSEGAEETHKRIAFLPLSGGDSVPAPVSSPDLPATVYTVRADDKPLFKRRFTGTKVRSTDRGATGLNAPDWNNVAGAFMIKGFLYVAHEDGSLTKQTFDGTSYGPTENVDTGDALVRQAQWHDQDVPKLTSIVYYRGALYYTLSGGDYLYKRGFEVQDDLVGELRSATKLSKAAKYGAFVAGGKFFYAGKSGYLYSMKWGAGGPSGKATAVSGPSKRYGSQNWKSKIAFVYQKG